MYSYGSLWLVQAIICCHCVVIQGTSAINKDGLYEGLEWLQTQISHKDMKKVAAAPVKESFVPLGEKLSIAFSSVKNYFWSTH